MIMSDFIADLCETCSHYRIDYPLQINDKQTFDSPITLDHYVFHCEIVDEKIGFNKMNEVVPYPCVNCPFNAYKNK